MGRSTHLWQRCSKLLWCTHLLFEPVLSTAISVTDFPEQIFYNPWENSVLCGVYVQVRRAKTTTLLFFVVFFFLERKSELRENNLVYCVWMRVLFHQLLTNRFTMIKAALHSALQRLLSMEELIYLPVIYIWWFNIGTKCQNKRRSKKKLLSDIKASQSHVIYILPPTGRNKRKIPPNNYMDLESQRVFAFDSTIDATLD